MEEQKEKINEYLNEHSYSEELWNNFDETIVNDIYKIIILGDLKINVTNPIVCVYMGIYYREKKDYDNAIICYKKAIEDYKYNEAYVSLADCYDEKKDVKNAIKYYEIGVEIGDLWAMHNLACLYEGIRDYQKMLIYYLMAIQKDFVSSMYNLGLYYEKIGDYDNMRKYLAMAVCRGRVCNTLRKYYIDNDMEP